MNDPRLFDGGHESGPSLSEGKVKRKLRWQERNVKGWPERVWGRCSMIAVVTTRTTKTRAGSNLTTTIPSLRCTEEGSRQSLRLDRNEQNEKQGELVSAVTSAQ